MLLSEKAPGSGAARNPLPPKIASLLRESGWFALLALALYLVLILYTYSKADPGWSHSTGAGTLHNAGGRAGAWIADVLLYLFGLSAYWWVNGSITESGPGNQRTASRVESTRSNIADVQLTSRCAQRKTSAVRPTAKSRLTQVPRTRAGRRVGFHVLATPVLRSRPTTPGPLRILNARCYHRL